jgi:hypothetical protein
MKITFCAKCGANATASDYYCKRCGEWLSNPGVELMPAVLRQWACDEIRKMRVLHVLSGGLSLTAAASLAVGLVRGVDTPMLLLLVLCCLAIAIFQLVNFFLAHGLEQRIDRSRSAYSEMSVAAKVPNHQFRSGSSA